MHLNRIHGMVRGPEMHGLVMSARRGHIIEQEESDDDAEREAEAEAGWRHQFQLETTPYKANFLREDLQLGEKQERTSCRPTL